MKIAVIGNTLQADVLTAILSQYGHDLYRVDKDFEIDLDKSVPDGDLLRLLDCLVRKKTLIVLSETADLPKDIACYFLCYSPNDLALAEAFLLESLPKVSHISKRWLINCGTFGLYGTQKLQSLVPSDEMVYLPDMVQEGNALLSFERARNLIVGVETEAQKNMLRELFRPIFPLESQYLWMPILDAELTKISISGMLATRISYMNDLASIAEKIGVDIMNIKEGLSSDSRIGESYLSPGVGFGGENFSHDILTLSQHISESGMRRRLLEQVWAVNEDQKELLFRKLWRFYETNLDRKKIAIWGATFKEGTTSTYNSPIHKMIDALLAQNTIIYIYDPMGNQELEKRYGRKVTLVQDKYLALDDADALCILTAWKEFYNPNYDLMREKMALPLILDGRNIYDPGYMKDIGFIYEGVGRK